MPYIDDDVRQKFITDIETLAARIRIHSDEDTMEGNLNFAITTLLCSTFSPAGEWRYKYINRAVGVLCCVLQEFYRRLAGPYEDKAILKNGDILDYSFESKSCPTK